jgi:hypothetical protein
MPTRHPTGARSCAAPSTSMGRNAGRTADLTAGTASPGPCGRG